MHRLSIRNRCTRAPREETEGKQEEAERIDELEDSAGKKGGKGEKRQRMRTMHGRAHGYRVLEVSQSGRSVHTRARVCGKGRSVAVKIGIGGNEYSACKYAEW